MTYHGHRQAIGQGGLDIRLDRLAMLESGFEAAAVCWLHTDHLAVREEGLDSQ